MSNNALIDHSIAVALQGLNNVSVTKTISLPEQNIQTSIVATKVTDGSKNKDDPIWSEFGYFGQQACDFHLDKENLPENSIFF